MVLERTESYGLTINKKKRQLLKRRIEFLGYVIKEGKLYPSPDKIKAVLRFSKPPNIK